MPVVVETRAGANGTIGVDAVAKATPDGNTLLLITSSPLAVVLHVQKTPYDTLRDLAPITLIGRDAGGAGRAPLVAGHRPAAVPHLRQAEDLRLASSGNGGLPHPAIQAAQVAAPAAARSTSRTRAGGPAITDAMAGHVDGVGTMDLAALLPHFKTGKLRPLRRSRPRSAIPSRPTRPNSRSGAGLVRGGQLDGIHAGEDACTGGGTAAQGPGEGSGRARDDRQAAAMWRCSP